MKYAGTLKKDILTSLDGIPPEGLEEVKTFIDFMRFKFKKKPGKSTPYIPIPLGGRWKKYTISEQDIEDIRKEMWQGFGDKNI